MIRRSTWIVAVIAFGMAAGAAGAAGKEPQYIGANKCRNCHKKELIGDQYGAWQKAKHSQAFEALKGEKALEIAKERGLVSPPSEAEECLKCHATAYGEDPSKFAKAPLDPEDGVQCESCHGPGSLYKKKKVMSDHAKSVAAGMWEPGKDEKICLGCHNEESPTWDPAVGFDFEKHKEDIAHPIPADVKGKYIEIEKKLKAEKRARGEAVEDEEEEVE
jgi:hypothetical protein